MKYKTTLLLIIIFTIKINGQNNYLHCWKAWTHFDKILEEKDTSSALMLFQSIEANKCPINKRRYLQISKITYLIGDIVESKRNFRNSMESGLMSAIYFNQKFDKLIEEGKSKYGKVFIKNMLHLNDSLIAVNIKKNGTLIHKLKEIYDRDQELRRIPDIKECKGYEFNFKLGFLPDTANNHTTLMRCAKEFRKQDSLILNSFIRIIDSLGYVPNDETVFGMLPIGPIINHTAHFNFKDLDRKILDSVKKGRISPRMYAWWKGYHNEYFLKPPEYYYVKNKTFFENLSDEDIEKINVKRMKIGLDKCPNVIWGSSPY